MTYANKKNKKKQEINWGLQLIESWRTLLKDLDKKEYKLKLYYKYIFFLILFYLSFSLFGEKGAMRIYALNNEITRIKTTTKTIEKENEQLRKEIISLKTDKNYIEKIARKEFNLVKEKDIVYIFK